MNIRVHDLNKQHMLNISTISQMTWLQNKYFCCEIFLNEEDNAKDIHKEKKINKSQEDGLYFLNYFLKEERHWITQR